MGGRGGGSGRGGGGGGGIKRDSSGIIMSITRGGRTFTPRRSGDMDISIPGEHVRIGDPIAVGGFMVSAPVTAITPRNGGLMFETSKGMKFSGGLGRSDIKYQEVSIWRGMR